jgi:hypothetical protein
MATQTTVATHSLRLMFLVAALFSCAAVKPQSFVDRVLGRKLQLYSCLSVSDATQCSSACTEASRYSVDFLADVDRKSVMLRLYQDGKPAASDALSNCIVFDNVNWICKSPMTGEANQMTKGVYFYDSAQSASQGRYSCAK